MSTNGNVEHIKDLFQVSSRNEVLYSPEFDMQNSLRLLAVFAKNFENKVHA
jgi:hypothetical protein